jgi:hypothetical protein
MKTTKIFSVISLALILFAATSASSGNIGTNGSRLSPTPLVNHHVNINVNSDKKTCNVYQVEILNGNGQLVAPAKTYIPGVSQYDFYERGPATGVRVAVLVLAPVYSHFSCETELFTAPVIKSGTFLPGQTYRYDLYPQTQPIKD